MNTSRIFISYAVKALFVTTFLGLLTACPNELEKQDDPVDTRVSQLASGEIKASYLGNPEPNSYKVELAWPDATGTVRISEHSKILAVQPGSERKFIDPSVKGGTTLSYLVEHINAEGAIKSSIPIQVEIPLDVFINSTLDMNESLKLAAHRVFIGPSGIITTYNKSLFIVADEFIGQGGTIQSFPLGAMAPTDRDGRSGGAISILAKLAVGTLQVTLRGEGGGQGKHGARATQGSHPGCAGTNGRIGGNAGSLNVEFKASPDFNISWDNIAGALGPAGVRGAVGDNFNDPNIVNPPCDRDNPDGQPGSPGQKGQVCLKLSEAQDYACQ